MTDANARVGSIDPRNWSRTVTSPSSDVVAAPPIAPAGGPALGRVGAGGLRWAASAAILIGAAVFAWSSRPPHPRDAATAADGDIAVETGSGTMNTGTVADTVAAIPAEERRMLVLSGAGDLEGALVDSGVDAATARAFVAKAMASLKPGGEIRAAMTLAPRGGGMDLKRLEASNADSSGVIVERTERGFAVSPVVANLTTRVVVRRGTMDDDSFYSSAVTAGVPNGLIADFAAALAFDFDFQREVRKGDTFEAAYEQRVDKDGRPVGPPALLFSSLSTQAKTAAAYRFTPPGGQPGWFDGEGRSVKRGLLRTPVEAARVSSGFGFRLHPILGYMKLHKGTDFAAPTGTPIYATGGGVVEWAAMKGPNGNLTILRHDNGWETYYLHQSMFMPGIAPGARVTQGQEIGKVGTTGRSTGPHLHYELHINGVAVDAMAVHTDAAPPLTGEALAAFRKERARIDVSRARGTA